MQCLLRPASDEARAPSNADAGTVPDTSARARLNHPFTSKFLVLCQKALGIAFLQTMFFKRATAAESSRLIFQMQISGPHPR